MAADHVPALSDPLTFRRGPAMANRFMLAPLTNCQSNPDGTCSQAEHEWLVRRAEGGFGATMTAAAHVQAVGQGFPGQIGIFGDEHIAGLRCLADGIRANGSVSLVQLHHAGNRAPVDLIGTDPVYPSDDPASGARALDGDEVQAAIDAYVSGAVRAEQAGFDGVELHGAHGYLICAFLSAESNQRTDGYGGSLANRARFLLEILAGIRERCRSDFTVGVRLSPERFGMQIDEILELSAELLGGEQVDFLDLSLWDCFKRPVEAGHGDKLLIELFAGLARRDVRLGVAGKLRSAADCRRALDLGADFALVGRAAIIHHDLPRCVLADPNFEPLPTPVPREHLLAEAVSPAFVDYLSRSFKGFVAAGG